MTANLEKRQDLIILYAFGLLKMTCNQIPLNLDGVKQLPRAGNIVIRLCRSTVFDLFPANIHIGKPRGERNRLIYGASFATRQAVKAYLSYFHHFARREFELSTRTLFC